MFYSGFGSGFVKLFFVTFLVSQTHRLGRERFLLCFGCIVAFVSVSLFVCKGLSSPYVGIWSLSHVLISFFYTISYTITI